MGRRSIEIKKIEDRQKLNITFSKRRTGLFSKAQELSNRSGDQVAIIVFSTSGRLYTFGEPGVDSVLDRYIQQGGAGDDVGGTSAAAADVPIDDDDDDDEDDIDDNDVNSEDDDVISNGPSLNDLLKASEKLEAEAEMKNKKQVLLDNYNDDGVNGLEAEKKRGGGTPDFLMKKRSYDNNDNERDHQLSLEEVEKLNKKTKMTADRLRSKDDN